MIMRALRSVIPAQAGIHALLLTRFLPFPRRTGAGILGVICLRVLVTDSRPAQKRGRAREGAKLHAPVAYESLATQSTRSAGKSSGSRSQLSP